MNASVQTVSPRALYERQVQGDPVTLVDVRTPAEFESLHAEGAILHPLENFQPDLLMETLGGDGRGKAEPIYLTCQSGSRASQAAQRLASAGFDSVSVVEGGTDAWAKADLPVVRGRRVLSLERQVQIALGTMLILKVVFGFAIHPAFFVLVGGIGIGLLFAGITQNCALARVIARMPWNQSKTCAAAFGA